MLVATAIIYFTGGTRTVGPQLMYLPIAAAAWFFRAPGGLIAGAIGGLMIGPLMPLNVDQDVPQDAANWMIRMSIFAMLGGALGIGFESRLNQIHMLRRLNDESVRAFVHTIDAKSKHTAQHSENVAWYAVQIGQRMGLSAAEIDQLRWEGLLHDIGKLTISDEVLNKPGPLDIHEWQVVKKHPAESVRILQGVHNYQPYLYSIRHHHERFDGTGYPDGIRGEMIPLHARILAVADAYDAMTSARPYRDAFSQQHALEEIQKMAGSQFDPAVVEAFTLAIQPLHDQLIPPGATRTYSGVAD